MGRVKINKATKVTFALTLGILLTTGVVVAKENSSLNSAKSLENKSAIPTPKIESLPSAKVSIKSSSLAEKVTSEEKSDNAKEFSDSGKIDSNDEAFNYSVNMEQKVSAEKDKYIKDLERQSEEKRLKVEIENEKIEASRSDDNSEISIITPYKKIQSFMANSELKGLEDSICSNSVKYKVDPYFIAAVAIHESGWGKSRIAHDKNNLFGLNAEDVDPYNRAFSFRRKEDSVEYFASMISDKYAGMDVSAIGKVYATDPAWSNSVKEYMEKIKES